MRPRHLPSCALTILLAATCGAAAPAPPPQSAVAAAIKQETAAAPPKPGILARLRAAITGKKPGVGLCEVVRHLAMFDYVAVSGRLDGRAVEYVEHLHEHFLDPVVIRDGCYVAPQRPGWSITMHPESVREFEFPSGPAWKSLDR